jgi:hypothetical protein
MFLISQNIIIDFAAKKWAWGGRSSAHFYWPIFLAQG